MTTPEEAVSVQRGVLEQALEALERSYDATEWPADGTSSQEIAAVALRAALAVQAPAQPDLTDEQIYDLWDRSFKAVGGGNYARFHWSARALLAARAGLDADNASLRSDGKESPRPVGAMPAWALVNELVEQGQFYKRGEITEAEFIKAVNHYADAAMLAGSSTDSASTSDGVPGTARCKGCDLPNGCPEYCRCTPFQPRDTCEGDPGECAYNGNCMYSCGVAPSVNHDLASAVRHIETAIRFAKCGIGPTPEEVIEWTHAMTVIKAACGVRGTCEGEA